MNKGEVPRPGTNTRMKTFEDIKKIAVLGAGTMGPGIAQTFAMGGYEVVMWTRSESTREKAKASLYASLKTFTEEGEIRPEDVDVVSPAEGMLTPYTAMVIFTLGIFLSNFIVNTIVMKRPFVGEPVSYKQYFAGNLKTHLVGVLGGCIWCLGTALNYICAGKAGAAVS